ncbi:D-alanyl-D-alanine carboxypeptidase family protein [Bacillus sp. PS06]|uniref:D-alanyl-D-alanine carboxypeptidase family protein n=1 Tax=Bacillus sp. PS06 TaxID=2764176 RepID=UPI00177EDA81|nr:D-alanyl-D-alanine carboxypeptidase family protein [Bacillus sp. PS06]MBD8070308.1 D-alanyl-D-alanine carboxypeptidase [Bacillus sp. PS06]
MTYGRKLTLLLITIMILISYIPQKTAAFGSVSAHSAVLIEQQTGRILYEKDAHTKRRIASITKIMTAILAVESGKMDEMVTVSSRAYGTEGSSLYLQEHEKIKLEDLVYGLMLRSGNDAAVAIAEHVGGSLEGFVVLMNQKAAEIGMNNTEFANPHGLDDHENHYSTAYDMAVLTKYAMNNDEFKIIFGTKVHRAPNPNEKWDRVWKNKNKLLTGLYRYSTGGKTGYTKRAKRTLVSTASKDGLDLIAVTINAGDDWNDHMNLFNSAFKEYQLVKIIEKGKLKKIKDSYYQNKLYINRDLMYPMTEQEKQRIEIDIKLLNPKENEWNKPEDVPNVVGTLLVKQGDSKISKLPIYFDHANNEKGNENWWGIFKKIFFITMGVKKDG